MNTIHKVALLILPQQRIALPEGARILHVNAQNDRPTLWYQCDTAAEIETKTIHLVGTGHAAPETDEARYLGTVLLSPFVWHVFLSLIN